MALNAAIFLDKDGTILQDVPYNVDPRQMRFAPGAKAGIARLAALGLPLIVVSNQPGVALGKFELGQLLPVRDRLELMFQQVGARLSGFYYCPHHPHGVRQSYTVWCDCRKPAAGLLRLAAARHNVDLCSSWFVGDILDDVEAGRRAGCHTLLLNNGNETVWHRNAWRSPECIESDLDAASLTIARHLKEQREHDYIETAPSSMTTRRITA